MLIPFSEIEETITDGDLQTPRDELVNEELYMADRLYCSNLITLKRLVV